MKKTWVAQDEQNKHVIGIYTTRQKARKASRAYIKTNETNKGEVTCEKRKHEIRYNRNGICLVVIDRWQINKAHIKGKWVVL